MEKPRLVSKAFFVIFATIFFLILGGFLSGRVLSHAQSTGFDALANVLQGIFMGGLLGLVSSGVLVLKLNSVQFVHASAILIVALIAEIIFIAAVNYFRLF